MRLNLISCFVLGASTLSPALAQAAIPHRTGIETAQCQILRSGFAWRSKRYVIEPMPQADSGSYRLFDWIYILDKTERIGAVRGAAFGFTYKVADVPWQGALDVVITHPKMVKPDGRASTGYSFKTTALHGTIIYGLDHDYEVVRGDWRISLAYDGVELCSRHFHTL